MTYRVLPAAFVLTALLAACGQTETAPTAAAPAAQQVQAAVPSAEEQAQLAALEAGLTRADGSDARPGLHAQDVGCPTKLVAPYDASSLDTGMYWYAPRDLLNPGGVGCKAREDGGAIPGFYDPQKPVLVYVHGWQPDSVKNGLVAGTTQSARRDNLWYEAGKLNVADAWLAAGWNVAIFQWTQLADDHSDFFMPFNSQAKIWTTNYVADDWGKPKPIGMRWMTPQGYSYDQMPTVSAGTLFYQAYKSALSQWRYAGAEPVRVVGHSLGAQMVLAMADQAYQDATLPARELPQRLVLADPYWSPNLPVPGHNYAYLSPDPNPAARSARIASEVRAKGAVIEWVKSSPLLDIGGDNNRGLLGQVTRTEILPEYIVGDLSAKHGAAPRWYLWSRSNVNGATSAANTLEQAKVLMDRHVQYQQLVGRFTAQPEDDSFWIPPF